MCFADENFRENFALRIVRNCHLLPEKLFGGNGQRKEQFSEFNFQNSGHKMIGSTFLSFYDLRSAINPALLRLIRTSNSKVNFCFRRGRTAIRRSSSEEAPWRNSPVNIFKPCVSPRWSPTKDDWSAQFEAAIGSPKRVEPKCNRIKFIGRMALMSLCWEGSGGGFCERVLGETFRSMNHSPREHAVWSPIGRSVSLAVPRLVPQLVPQLVEY